MSESCNDQCCSSCASDCSERQAEQNPAGGCPSAGQGQMRPEDFVAKPHELSDIGKVIGVVSGKGGVGKSLVTALLASAMKRQGHGTAILDADITGPSIPRIFGLKERAAMSELGLYPVRSQGGTDIMSLNLLIDNETDPVVWRGPVIGGAVKQFWTDVIWGEAEYMFIDMPPGTGDVPLTVYQSIRLDGLVIVTSPQELVTMIVEKAVNMARMMNIPVLGLVENMSFFKCPDCGRETDIFGKSHVEETAARFNIKTVARLPLDPSFAKACDEGQVESIEAPWLNEILQAITRA
ncbi:ATP-binding protein [Deltaproteobacteria bacterium Smac51]|nr:ATP-binding protein [Deltaproteobacteria bacterium Smac51]